MPQLSDVLAGISERRGSQLSDGLLPVTLRVTLDDGCDPHDPRTLSRVCATIEPTVNPDLAAVLDASGATRRGDFSWSVGLADEWTPLPLANTIDLVRPSMVYAKSSAVTTRGPSDISLVRSYIRAMTIKSEFYGTAAHAVLNDARNTRLATPYTPTYGMVTLSTDGRVLWISVNTFNLGLNGEGVNITGVPHVALNLRPCGRQRREPRRQVAAEVVRVVGWARAHGVEVTQSEALTVLEHTAAHNVAAWPTRGRPAQASASIGRFVDHDVRSVFGTTAVPDNFAATLCDTDAATVATLSGGDLAATQHAGVHPAVADIAAMEAAESVSSNRFAKLKGYQREIVGLHLATSFGFVNALPTGMGKTITTLTAQRERSRNIAAWRGLVVVEANVRSQWVEACAEWFPEARVVAVSGRKDADTLFEALDDVGSNPLLVICSYSLAADAATAEPHVAASATSDAGESSTKHKVPAGQLSLFDTETLLPNLFDEVATTGSPSLGSILLGTHWHDIVADEAMGLRSTGSKLAAALWRLRNNASVAVALTGTPITKGLDDIARLISWVRSDRDLFRGHRLEKNFDISDDDGLADYLRAVGPLVARRDKSELDGEIPSLAPKVVRLEPTRSEKALATAARVELKRVYDELLSWMDVASTSAEAGSVAEADLIEAREALRAARGAWLGGTQLARMCSSDPEAVLGSNSAGAALLASQGLIADACDDGGTKRTWCVEYCKDRVASGSQILVFTEFATVAKRLIAELRAEGISVGAVLGGGGAARDRDIASFCAGDLSVLVSTSSGERGLNLQVADTIIHYDLPWTPDGVVQRTGRVIRIGSSVDEVQIVFPVMSSTIEERVAAMVVARAMTALRALDSARGVAAADSELGRCLGDLASNVDIDAVEGANSRMLAMTKEILAG